MKTDTGGSAYPQSPFMNDKERKKYQRWAGMSLLDYFAGQALAGVLANPNMIDITYETIAKNSYALAQAMIEEKRRLEK